LGFNIIWSGSIKICFNVAVSSNQSERTATQISQSFIVFWCFIISKSQSQIPAFIILSPFAFKAYHSSPDFNIVSGTSISSSIYSDTSIGYQQAILPSTGILFVLLVVKDTVPLLDLLTYHIFSKVLI
jgi:hypothetical protein